jgi:hypothetical protein
MFEGRNWPSTDIALKLINAAYTVSHRSTTWLCVKSDDVRNRDWCTEPYGIGSGADAYTPKLIQPRLDYLLVELSCVKCKLS